MKRPTCNGSHITTPTAATMLRMLGGKTHGNIALTTSQMQAVNKLYGYVPEKPNARPKPPPAPEQADYKSPWDYDNALRDHKQAMESWAKWKDPIDFLQAGADRNAFRHAEADGLRIIAWLARFVEAGQDPLKLVVQLASEGGLDVYCEDLAWANDEIEKGSDEDA